jgi:hypothetical protein
MQKEKVTSRYILLSISTKRERILLLEATSEKVRAGKVLKKLVGHAPENNSVKRVIADEVYDNNDNFDYISYNDVEPAIKV